MEEFYGLLVDLFGGNTEVLEVTPGNTQKLEADIAIQTNLYEKLARAVTSIPIFEDGTQIGAADPTPRAKNIIAWMIDTSRSAAALTHTGRGNVLIRSTIPVLENDNVTRFVNFILRPPHDLEVRTLHDARSMSDAFAAAFLVCARTAVGFESTIMSLVNASDGYTIFASMTEFTAHKLIRERANVLEGDLRDKFEGTTNRVALYAEQIDLIKNEQEAEIAKIGGEINETKLSVDELKSAVSGTRARLNTFETAIRQELQLDRSRLSWDTRYKEARFGFNTSIWLIIAFAVLTFVVAFFSARPFIEMLSALEVKTASDSISVALAHQFGRLLVFSVPVIVYLWVFRALMRFFMRSMLLMDDARQRQTMLDTYFLLSEKGRADERDRPMILWSLFRQTPGHGSDGIEPPDFTEVINAGLKRMGDKG